MALLLPDLRGAPLRPPFGGIEREQLQKRTQALVGDLSDERDGNQIPVMEERGGFGDTDLRRVGRGVLDHQRVGRDADGKRRPERRLLDGFAETRHRQADGRVFGRIERPVSRSDEQRPGELQHAPAKLRR